jgi:LysR family glycine cleavage system transcriptional activator
VEHALDEIEAATRRLMARPNVSAVNIDVAPAFLTRWLVPRISEFKEQHPDVELRLHATNSKADFIQSDTDMAIYLGSSGWKDAESVFLRGVSMVVVCSPQLLEQDNPLEKPLDLKHQCLLHVSTRNQDWYELLDGIGIGRSSIEKFLTFSSTALAISAAIEGLGVALTDRKLVERELRYGLLVMPFDLKLESERAFFLAYQKRRRMTQGMKAFHDWILDQMKHERAAPLEPAI